jgi:DMSO/TMAO reductase YedYZ molybdopterin-dependent catalytic subunit
MPRTHSLTPITRSDAPLVVEFPFADLSDVTPSAQFFIRNHFPVPDIDTTTWKLRVEGAVHAPLSISLDELRSMAAATTSAVIECSGNSRAFMQGNPRSIQWGLGGVGCATWTGVPLRDVLMRAGIDANAVDVIFEGADHGPERQLPTGTDIHFARSVPLAVAMRADVILAFEMNEEPLDAAHGAPVRVIVPGWYGVTSVKWLSRVIVTTRAFTGFFQSAEYAYWDASSSSSPERVPVSTLQVKSEIARPTVGEEIVAGVEYRVYGAAWTSEASIVSVEVSTDGGRTWNAATLGDTPDRHAWQLWELWWTPREPGEHVVLARATDSSGRVQPVSHDVNHENYMVHHILPIPVLVV